MMAPLVQRVLLARLPMDAVAHIEPLNALPLERSFSTSAPISARMAG